MDKRVARWRQACRCGFPRRRNWLCAHRRGCRARGNVAVTVSRTLRSEPCLRAPPPPGTTVRKRPYQAAPRQKHRFDQSIHAVGTVPAIKQEKAERRHDSHAARAPPTGLALAITSMDTQMIADLLLDADLAEQTTDANSTFAQRHPLQIAVCLRKLMAGQDFVTVEFNGRQIVTQVLDVDSRNARFIFDAGSTEQDNYALPPARQLIFRSLPGGIRTEFTTLNADPIMLEGRPAFEASFPSLLYYVQRREFFRVQTPVLDPYIATGPYVDGGSFRLELQDLSLGGVALKTADAHFGSLESRTALRHL